MRGRRDSISPQPIKATVKRVGNDLIIDGKRLGHFLELHEPTEAIRAYELERLPITSGLVRSNRLGGPERVVDVVSERAPNGFDKLEDVISQDELIAISKGYAKMAGFAIKENAPGQ